MAKRKLTKLERAGLTAVVVTGCLYLYVVTLYRPRCAKLDAVRREWTTLRKEVAGLKEQSLDRTAYEEMKKTIKQLSAAEARLAGVEECLVTDERLPEALSSIIRLASLSGVRIETFVLSGKRDTSRKTGGKKRIATSDGVYWIERRGTGAKRAGKKAKIETDEEADAPLTSVQYRYRKRFTLTVEGRFTAVKDFVRGVGELPTMVLIEAVSIERGRDETAVPGELEAVVELAM